MKSLVNLCSALLDDLGSICSVETARDLKTIKSRAQHEGVSFLTITLPNFATDFENCLEHGRIGSTSFSGWKKKGCLPAFLQGFTSLVFEASGEVKEDAEVNAIFAVRQICRAFKKIRIECSNERFDAAFEKYEQLEAVLPDVFPVDDDRLEHFAHVCDHIWTDVFGHREFNSLGLVPRHGPGATAEGISGNAKYLNAVWTERLEEVFPFTDYLFSSLNQLDCPIHGIDRVEVIEESMETPVRVIGVPKTLKTPRIIAIEPVCMQYTQQAVARWVMKKIERSNRTRRCIRFTDQSVNQRIAISSSLDRKYATLDLSDASDRVLLSMVEVMLRSQPELLKAVLATRSTRAKLPNGNILTLKKFASMGSALCFPIESMYFYSILVHSRLWAKNLPPEPLYIDKMCKGLHVYGDDLLVPINETDIAIEGLTAFACKVNADKSFSKGFFRESCGADAYHGINVTPVYIREKAPQSKRDSAGLLSWISTSNQFHLAGCWKVADYMKNVIESLLGGLPVVMDESPGLGWISFCGIPVTRMCKHLHAPVVFTYKVTPRRERDPLEGYPALLKYFLRSSDEFKPITVIDKRHLRFSVRSGSVSRKRHWVLAV